MKVSTLLLFIFCAFAVQMHAQEYVKVYDDGYTTDLSVLRSDNKPIIAINTAAGSALKGLDDDGNVLWNIDYIDNGDPGILFIHADNSVTYFTKGLTYALSMHNVSETGEETATVNYTYIDLGFDAGVDSSVLMTALEKPDDTYEFVLENGWCPGYDKHANLLHIGTDGTILSNYDFCIDYLAGDPRGRKLFFDGTNYLLMGNHESFWIGTTNKTYIMQLDETANVLSSYLLDDHLTTDGVQLADGYLFCGYTGGPYTEPDSYYLLKTDFTGAVVSETDFTAPVFPVAMSADADGYVLLMASGITYEPDGNYFVKFNTDLSTAWTGDLFNTPTALSLSDFAIAGADDFLLTGRTNFTGYYYYEHAMVARTNEDGVVPIDQISGTVYYDENDNGIFDGGEHGVPAQTVTSSYSGLSAVSNSDGEFTYYEFTADPFTTDLSPSPEMIQTVPAAGGITVTPDFGAGPVYVDNTLLFGENFVTEGVNAGIYVLSGGIAPGFADHNYIYVTNIGSEDISSATVTFTFPSCLTYSSSTLEPFDITPTSMKFTMTDIPVFSTHWFTVSMLGDLTFAIGDTIPLGAYVDVDGDIDATNNYDALNVIAVASSDPNHKYVYTDGSNADGNVDPATQWLDYQIEFQNLGTGNTHFVTITDTLDENLDASTFMMTSASAPYEVVISSPHVVKWIFNDLSLTPASEDEEHSTGFVSYRIKIADGLPEGTSIQNSAAIYFDYNPAVITNTTKTVLKEILSVVEPENISGEVYPNPVMNGSVQISGNNQYHTYELTDITGKIVETGKVEANTIHFSSWNALPAGEYFLSISNRDKTVKCKITHL